MSKPETLGVRPSEYSEWHRSLGQGCYAVDVDWVEWREGRGIVALIATTGNCESISHCLNSLPKIWERTQIERTILRGLAFAAGVPSFYVVHTTNLESFVIINLEEQALRNDFDKVWIAGKAVYEKWLRKL